MKINSNSILSVAFFTLFLVIVVEIVYIFSLKNNTKTSLNNNLVPTKTISEQTNAPNNILAASAKKYDYWIDKSKLLSWSTLVFTGDLVKIEQVNDGKNGIKFTLSRDKDVSTFYYNDEWVKKITIFEINNGEKKLIDLSSLKEGDRLSIQEDYKYMDPKTEVTISKEKI